MKRAKRKKKERAQRRDRDERRESKVLMRDYLRNRVVEDYEE